MARRLCQLLLALAVLYGIAVGAYAVFAYDGKRPDVVTIAGEMHAWVRNGLSYKYVPPSGAPAPGDLPPAHDAPPLPKLPPVPPGPPRDARTTAVERVANELLPRAREQAKALADRSSPDFEIRRTAAMVTLNQARDLLGPYIDRGEADDAMRKLYKEVSDLLIAVRKK
jgi:hypothetical protein